MNYSSIQLLFHKAHLVSLPQINETDNFLREGNPESALAVIVKKSDIAVPAQREILHRLLQAIKCPLPDAAALIIIDDNQQIKIFDICHHIHITKIVIFGVPPKNAGVFGIVRNYYISVPISGKQLLFSESLEALHRQKEKKADLWGALQTLFF
jgi:hypothetical protein